MAHEHGDGHGVGLVTNARSYEMVAVIEFLGRRRQVYDGLVTLSGAKPGDRVLDIGCGTGYFTRRAARAVSPGGHATGIDPSQPVIDYATGHAPPNCTFQVAGAQALPHPDASFDVVVSSLAMHHVPADDRPTALTEMRRVLRPGGRLLIAEFGPPRNGFANLLTGTLFGHARRHHAIADLPGLITAAGFEVIGSGDRWPSLAYVLATPAS